MCDCYYHKCECCEKEIPMHIADWDYPHSDFKVYCQKHLDVAPRDSVVFEITKLHPWDAEKGFRLGWKCAISGPEVTQWENHPNMASEMSES